MKRKCETLEDQVGEAMGDFVGSGQQRLWETLEDQVGEAMGDFVGSGQQRLWETLENQNRRGHAKLWRNNGKRLYRKNSEGSGQKKLYGKLWRYSEAESMWKLCIFRR
jgi:hypothetical protein